MLYKIDDEALVACIFIASKLR